MGIVLGFDLPSRQASLPGGGLQPWIHCGPSSPSVPAGGKALGWKPRLECIGELDPQGVEAKPLAQRKLHSVTLRFVAPCYFSPLPMKTLVGFAASLSTDSTPPKKNALCVHAVCVLGAGSGLGTRSSPGQAQAPSTALAVSVAPGRWRRGWLGGRVGWWVHPGNSIVLGLAGSVSAGLRDARRSRTGC